MTKTTNFLAFDLGAESGRAVLGHFDGAKLSLSETHRFPNGPVRLPTGLYWNVLSLYVEMKRGLSKAHAESGGQLTSLGLDTWGVDFALLDRAGHLIGNPHHYRDSRNDGMLEKAFELVPREEIFKQTGIQFLQLNSLYQLLSMSLHKSPKLEVAATLLMMPDLFNYWLTGRRACEYTDATTSQCFDTRQGKWAYPLLEKFGLPTHIFPAVVPPGAELGLLLPSVADEAGVSRTITVIAPGSHDTASAVAAVPVAEAAETSFAYISSGTWSLVGVETDTPVITSQSLAYNFTNEGGVENTIRLLKNVMGLWLVQECRRIWGQQSEEYSYAQLTDLAAEAVPFAALIEPDNPAFFAPGDMPARIREFCARTGQTPPDSKGGFVRCALESLAFKYRWVIDKTEELTQRPVTLVHIVGGGSQNRLLNQFAANATGRPVVAGPVEATAIGNVLMQMLAMKQISSLAEGRALVRRSFPVDTYEPQETEAWAEAYQRFVGLMGT